MLLALILYDGGNLTVPKLNIRPFDLAFSIIILALLFAVPYWYQHRDSGVLKEVKVFKENKLIAVGPIDADRLITVGKMEIEIKNGKVRVLHSDCPKGLCVGFGRISSPGESIVCVANKVLVEVSGKTGDDDIVAMSY